MAYINQETKSLIAAKVKQILKKYNVSGTLSIRDHMTLCLTVRRGSVDFFCDKGYIQVNPYHYHNHFSGEARDFLDEIFAAMNEGNYNNSRIEYDIHDVGWYVSVNIGKWDKPYIFSK